MRAIDLVGGTEVIPEQESRELLETQAVGRLAVVVDDRPEIFPVNYRIEGKSIIVETNAGPKLLGALTGRVAFEVDAVDVSTQWGWSVVAHGSATVEPLDDATDASRPGPWAGPKGFEIRIDVASVTGRRLQPRGERG
jgi:nitroimidazol reductase NimA-like FMN-containing flavoprotein (pyridoxamine 5'-phosphate oxidase superfamily)